MNTAIVELDSLSDTVGTAAQDHDLGLVLIHRVLIRRIISGVEISAVLRAADMHALPGFLHAQRKAALSYGRLRDLQKLTQIFIGKTVLFGCDQHLIWQHLSFMLQNSFLFLHQLFHLLDKISLHLGDLKNLLHRCPLAQRLIHEEMPFAGRRIQSPQQLLLRQGVKILRMPQTVTPCLQRTDCLLESFLIRLTDTHDLAHGAHLGTQLVLHTLELLKSPTGKLDHHIVAVRHIFI